jgi:ATP-dependent RNA helicase DeaD
MARLFLRVGRQDGVRPADVVGAIANEAGLPGSAVGDIDLYDRFSFVEVPEDDVEAVLGALNSTTIKGREPRASIARQEDEPRGGDDWRPRGDQQGGASGGFDRREGGREGRFRGGAPRSGPRGPRRDRPSEDRRQPRRNRW